MQKDYHSASAKLCENKRSFVKSGHMTSVLTVIRSAETKLFMFLLSVQNGEGRLFYEGIILHSAFNIYNSLHSTIYYGLLLAMNVTIKLLQRNPKEGISII